MSEPIAIRQRRKRASTWHTSYVSVRVHGRVRPRFDFEAGSSHECGGLASWSDRARVFGRRVVRGNGGHAECCRVSLFRLCYKLKP
jgi:hypothetical protein